VAGRAPVTTQSAEVTSCAADVTGTICKVKEKNRYKIMHLNDFKWIKYDKISYFPPLWL
jgi:hypothetical protein